MTFSEKKQAYEAEGISREDIRFEEVGFAYVRARMGESKQVLEGINIDGARPARCLRLWVRAARESRRS